ncbi:MAG: phosphodiester glycosidase family protein [Bacteroidales bacterium]|nr:phosphodiester glycosidase family protein [Bacteroidales bacterium]
MKRLTYSWAILLCLLAFSCKQPAGPDLPPPTPSGQNETPSGQTEQQGTDPDKPKDPGPWDANRGKYVVPSGAGWSKASVADGITYYIFSGTESVSGAKQRIHVADIDMTTEKYKLGLVYHSDRRTASQVFTEENAIVSMNGGYEVASIVIKVGGSYKSVMPNNNIGDTSVPNWKNEGALYFSNGTDPRIRFDGKGKTIAEQRTFYYSSKWSNILTSAPMLIDDFEPVGETFVSYTGNLNSLNYEDPRRHQGVRHPRTAIATTENNHLLMIVIDGRRTGISEGMTAKEVTGFLVKNFNPQYALNLDGGGSTSMCIAGKGDPNTHLVNNPTDEGGERSVTSHLYIIEKK